MATPNEVLDIARKEIGYDRFKDPERGTKYGRWYAKLTGDSYYGDNGVPYCAMYVSWVFAQAGQSCPGLPGAYCPWIVTAGKKAGQTVSTKNAKAGDVVLFDWGGDGVSDHVGIVESNNGSYLTCIEGNTSSGNDSNGGKVQRRTRAYSTVICIIRPKYNQTGWQKDNRGWWYNDGGGNCPKETWCKINDRWYYFNSEGYALTGWYKLKGTWYYFTRAGEGVECSAACREVRQIDGYWYAFNNDCHMLLGSIQTDSGGRMKLG